MRTYAEYETANAAPYGNYQPAGVRRERYVFSNPNEKGVITKKSRSGSYNVIEKDFGDHKRVYHVPIEYGDNFDLSQLDEPPVVELQNPNSSPRLVQRRIYEDYGSAERERGRERERDIAYGYVKEVPVTATQRVYVPPKRPSRETEVIERVYEAVPVNSTVEYVYEDDRANVYELRPEKEKKVEYVVRETVPQPIVKVNKYIRL
jgi:hypothetical protein